VTIPSRHTSLDMSGESSSRGDTRWKPNEPVNPRWMGCSTFAVFGRRFRASWLMTSSNGGMNSVGFSSSLRPHGLTRHDTAPVPRRTWVPPGAWRGSRHSKWLLARGGPHAHGRGHAPGSMVLSHDRHRWCC
jgi:hypothetical protein